MLSLKERLEKIVDPEYGLIHYLSVLPKACDEARLFVGIALIQDPLSLPPQNTFTGLKGADLKQGSGVGFTLEDCLWSTIGESLERYSSCIYDARDLIVDSYENLCQRQQNAVDPQRFIRFSTEQYQQRDFPLLEPMPHHVMGWTRCINMSTGEETLVPASMVYMLYTGVADTDGRLDLGYSTGLAAGNSYAMAIHSGLREVIERDSYALHWLAKKTAPKIDLEELCKQASPQVCELLNQPNLDIDIRDYTTDLDISCVLCQIKSDSFHGVASGSSCNPDGLKCAEKAVAEAMHTLDWCFNMKKQKVEEIELEDIVQYEHHVRYYFKDRPESRSNLDFMFKDAPTSSMNLRRGSKGTDLRKQTLEMISKLKTKGYDVFVADVTSDDVRDAGFVVVRVLVPGLQPLYAGTGREHLDTRRLEEFTANVKIPMPNPIDLAPHPFP